MQNHFFSSGPYRFALTITFLSAFTLLSLASAWGQAGGGNKAVLTPNSQGRILSAFFGLDNALPFIVHIICPGGAGKDGMPVVLSHIINPDALKPEQFQIITRNGDVHVPKCVTARPAGDPGETRTALLIGEFGDAPENPPEIVRIIGNLVAQENPLVSFQNAEVKVTPINAGPSLVWGEPVSKHDWGVKGIGTSCPKNGIRQIIRVTWDGGVRLPNGDDPGDEERQLYRVKVRRPDRSIDIVVPVALADLKDNDNNHFLCLDTADPAVTVSFPAGYLVDPNRDLNPDTQIKISR